MEESSNDKKFGHKSVGNEDLLKNLIRSPERPCFNK